MDKKAQALDVLLNEVYRYKRNMLSNEQKSLLKTAQLDWLKFRESNCDMQAGQVGGTMQTIVLMACTNEMTANRIAELDLIIAE